MPTLLLAGFIVVVSVEVYEILTFVPIALMTIGIVSGGFKIKELGKVQKLLLVLITLAFVAEAFSFALRSSGYSNFVVHHVYALVEFVLLALMFRELLARKWARIALVCSIPVMVLLAVTNALFLQSINTPNTNVIITSSVIMIVLSTLLFYELLSQMRYDRIEKSTSFWINAGILIYFSSTIMMFAYLRFLTPLSHENVGTVFILNIFFNIIHYLCFNIALWMDPE